MLLDRMTIQGVAPRRVIDVLETLCGFQISAMDFSPAAKETRYSPLYLASATPWRYAVHSSSWPQVQSASRLTSFEEDAKRTILGVSVALGEHEIHQRSYM